MMIPIKELLNKIFWDDRYDAKDYSFLYHDRVKDNLMEREVSDIRKIEGSFLLIDVDGKETSIPLHRIRKVMKGKMLVWKREPPPQ